MEKSNLRKVFYLTGTILIVCFIFLNSLQNGESSGDASNFVLNLAQSFLNMTGINIEITGLFIRKLAHFVEFFIFGFFMMLTFEAFLGRTVSVLGFPLFLGILVPVLDEYIQLFSSGRVSSVSDVVLDFFGVITAITYVCIWIYIKNKFKNTNNRKYKYNYKKMI